MASQVNGFVSNEVILKGKFTPAAGGGDRYPTYTGSYNVTPKTDAQTLNTAIKSLINDIEVKAIPYSEVTNPSGGNTVTIG